MKSLLIVCICLLLSVGSLSGQEDDLLKKSDNRIEVVLDQNVSREILMDLKKQLWKEEEIILDINRYVVNANGKLQSIKISVDCKDGFKGTYQNRDITADARFGFYRDYKATEGSPFGIGTYPFSQN